MKNKVLLRSLLAGMLALTMLLTGCGSTSGSTAANPPADAGSSADASAPAESTPSDIDYPPSTVEIVVTAAAGGDIDFMARLFAEKLSERWGNNVIVTDVGGGNVASATYGLKDGASDGSQVILLQSNIAIQTINGVFDFGLDGLKYSMCVGQLPGYLVVVPASSGITTMEELKAAAEANPGQLRFGMTYGGSTEITAKMLQEGMGVTFNLVEAGTSSDKVTALLGGHLDLTTIPYGNAAPYLESGEFVALASLGDNANPYTPDIASTSSWGIDTEFSIRYAFVFSPDTPDEIIEVWNEALAEIIESDADYAARLEEQYVEAPFSCSADELLTYFGGLQDLARKYLG